MQSQVRFNRVLEKVQEKVSNSLWRKLNRVPKKVPKKVPEKIPEKVWQAPGRSGSTGFQRRFRGRSGRLWCRASSD